MNNASSGAPKGPDAPDPKVHSGPPTTRRSRAALWGVTVICLLVGVLFGTSASLARENGAGATRASDLAELISARDAHLQQLTEDAEQMRQEVEALQEERANSESAQLNRDANELAPAGGLTEVSGAAVRVTLDDAGYSLDTLPTGYTVDDVVVHQQDLQGVVNALWAGGAEAIMVQDQRIVATSAIKCVGNTLYLKGRVYSPPFVVTAIGDPDRLHTALQEDSVVSNYRAWAEILGLGYQVEDVPEIQMPAYHGSVRTQYATIVES